MGHQLADLSQVAKSIHRASPRIVDALVEAAQRNDTTVATVALAWIIARPSVTAPIASATPVEQLKSLAAATRPHLSSAELALLNQASTSA